MSSAVAEQIDTGKGTRRKVPKSNRPSVWTQYRVTWHFLTRLCGSVPADPEMIQKWLEVREPRVKAAGARSIQEINEEVLASLEEGEKDESEFSLLKFQRHDGILVQRYGTVRAHFKDCARVLSNQYIGRIKGERAFSTRVVNGVYLDEHQYWLPILREGSPVTDSDGFMDKAVHVRGPRGEPLNALKRIEYIEPPSSITFTVKVLGQSVTEDDLHTLMEYGGTHGYAGERSDGEGRYEYEIERVTE
jgi:hypothetical protein